MKNLSSFQVILMIVFGMAALIGLFVFATYTSNNSDGGSVGIVTAWGTLPEESMQAALASAAQSDQTLKGVSYIQKDAAMLASELATAIATGAAPDLVLASHEELLSLRKFLLPLQMPARDYVDAFIDEANLLAIAPGQYYGVPFLVDPLVLFYNESILSSSGIAKPPATWEALIGLVPSVAQLTSTRQVTRGLIALGTYANVRNARGILSALFLQQGVPVSAYTSNGALAADLGQSAERGTPPGESVLGFYTQFADPSKVSYTWNPSLPDSRQAFLSRDLALYLGYVSEAKFLRQANPNLDFDIAPLPQPGTAQVKRAYGLLYSFYIPRGAKNPSGAYSAAAILSGSNIQEVVAGATGLTPVSRDALSSAPADPVAAVGYAQALYSAGWLSPAVSDTDTVFSAMIGNVISGRMNLSAALTSAERSLTNLLQQ